MITDVYFAQKDKMFLIAYQNEKDQNVFLQIDKYTYAPQIVNTVICDSDKYSIRHIIESYFEYTLLKQERKEIGIKFRHIWKPLINVKIQQELDFTTVELCRAKRDLGILIQKLQDILLYIEPNETGLKTYSHKVRELLFLACSDFESTIKTYKLGKNERSADYVKILDYVDLTKYKISLIGYANAYTCAPFEHWNSSEPTKSIPWYNAYNNIKHDREANFQQATLENGIKAISANLILFALRYSPMALYNENDVCSNLARNSLDYRIENTKDIYIPIIEGNRSCSGMFSTQFTFRNGKSIPDIYDIANTLPFVEREISHE